MAQDQREVQFSRTFRPIQTEIMQVLPVESSKPGSLCLTRPSKHTYKLIADAEQDRWLRSQLKACRAVIDLAVAHSEGGRVPNLFGAQLGEMSRITGGGSDGLSACVNWGMFGKSGDRLASNEWRFQFQSKALWHRIEQHLNGDLHLPMIKDSPRVSCEGLDFVIDKPITMLIFRLDEVGDWWVTLHLNLRPPLRRNMPEY